jgi:ATP-dependent RNA helicase DeaD
VPRRGESARRGSYSERRDDQAAPERSRSVERREPPARDDGASAADKPEARPEASGDVDGRPPRSPHAAELFVSIGRKDGARASDFYAVLEQRAGITIDDTDYVNVRQRHTFIGLPKDLLAKALEALNGATIAGREATAEPSRSNQ